MRLFRFTDNLGSFESAIADKIKGLYFPLCNERLLSSISPDLHGDIKSGQNHFLLTPVSRIDLIDSRTSRNFWVYINKDKTWSLTGAPDKFNLKAGLLWHNVLCENKKLGLKSEILSFVPASEEPIEIMQVTVTNISSRKIGLIPTAAIPIYGRGANNLRDHRQVTSLLQRVRLHKFGVIVKPALAFDEAGHKPNKTSYFVLGWDDKFIPPRYIYPTEEMFCGEAGNLEAPESVLKNIPPDKQAQIQGREAMGALRFPKLALGAGESKTYIIVMGITDNQAGIKNMINKFSSTAKVNMAFEKTRDYWVRLSEQIKVSSADTDFDNWLRWVSIQPTLRRIFGCSFLPDFDYGKGGRGWRDLWQDSLGLILSDPEKVRDSLINNFSGVRIDGSNATIIAKKQGEFISDRNNISRVWMDHAVWPLLTLDLYLNETGDYDVLFSSAGYFCDRRDTARKIRGTVLEHLLLQHLVQFFNVGRHNHIRLQGADWNDGLDMAKENGESVAFSCMYASNLKLLAELLEKSGKQNLKIAKELKILLGKINYDNVRLKQKLLSNYFKKASSCSWTEKVSINARWLAGDLRSKSEWMMQHIRRNEWLKEGFFNGYYDNLSRRVEGKKDGALRMMLTSQVFALISGVARDGQVNKILKNIEKYLFDKKINGYHLNTDFKQEQHNLGRAFSFIYGDKENGAIFNHMVVIYAYALYKRGLINEGWRALNSVYNMAIDTEKSKIYPCMPEYFNLQGRGMYSYLTGSASWFILTLLTEAFGVKGEGGSLLIEPKLSAGQFKKSANISINRIFAERNLCVTFSNPRKLDYAKYKIKKVVLNGVALNLHPAKSIYISRKIILRLAKDRQNNIGIFLD